MKMSRVRAKAKAHCIKTFGKKKAVVIREIQIAEGNFPCFASACNECDQTDCCWRGICFTQS
jgi:hypothetical protein